jgi:hypothetical protein
MSSFVRRRTFAVTIEGHLLGLDVDALSYSAEDRIRLTASDYDRIVVTHWKSTLYDSNW